MHGDKNVRNEKVNFVINGNCTLLQSTRINAGMRSGSDDSESGGAGKFEGLADSEAIR